MPVLNAVAVAEAAAVELPRRHLMVHVGHCARGGERGGLLAATASVGGWVPGPGVAQERCRYTEV